MEEIKVGTVVKYFAKPSVAAINLSDGPLRVGDTIRIKGHSTDMEQVVDSMQIEHAQVTAAEKGSSIGIKVNERVREHDVVYVVKK